jgi:hypothetical protein
MSSIARARLRRVADTHLQVGAQIRRQSPPQRFRNTAGQPSSSEGSGEGVIRSYRVLAGRDEWPVNENCEVVELHLKMRRLDEERAILLRRVPAH